MAEPIFDFPHPAIEQTTDELPFDFDFVGGDTEAPAAAGLSIPVAMRAYRNLREA